MSDKLIERLLLPSGYYDCCGRSRSRGHWEGCYRAVEKALSAISENLPLLEDAGRQGTVAREDRSQSHYVMVRFDGRKFASPCHPTSLEYLSDPQP